MLVAGTMPSTTDHISQSIPINHSPQSQVFDNGSLNKHLLISKMWVCFAALLRTVATTLPKMLTRGVECLKQDFLR